MQCRIPCHLHDTASFNQLPSGYTDRLSILDPSIHLFNQRMLHPPFFLQVHINLFDVHVNFHMNSITIKKDMATANLAAQPFAKVVPADTNGGCEGVDVGAGPAAKDEPDKDGNKESEVTDGAPKESGVSGDRRTSDVGATAEKYDICVPVASEIEADPGV